MKEQLLEAIIHKENVCKRGEVCLLEYCTENQIRSLTLIISLS